MSSAIALFVLAIALVPVGGVFAAVDSALNTISSARIDEMAKEERAGAARVQRILTDRPRYVNLMVLLRILCEITATVVANTARLFVVTVNTATTMTFQNVCGGIVAP